MPLRQPCAAGCAALALLMIAVGAPLMDAIALGGEEVDKIGDAAAIADQRAIIAGFCRGNEGDGQLMMRKGRLKIRIGGPDLGLARELQRVEIGSRLISPRLGFAHSIVANKAVEQFPAELEPYAPGLGVRIKRGAAGAQAEAIELAIDATQSAVSRQFGQIFGARPSEIRFARPHLGEFGSEIGAARGGLSKQ